MPQHTGMELREREEHDLHLFRRRTLYDTVSAEISGQENIIRLVTDTATAHKVTKMAEAPGAVARLFFEFAPCCRCRCLAIEPTGRTLQQRALERMTIHL